MVIDTFLSYTSYNIVLTNPADFNAHMTRTLQIRRKEQSNAIVIVAIVLGVSTLIHCELYTWGLNSYGQLGLGTTTTQSIPIINNKLSNITIAAIAAGGSYLYYEPFLCYGGCYDCWFSFFGGATLTHPSGCPSICHYGAACVCKFNAACDASCIANVGPGTKCTFSYVGGHTLVLATNGNLYSWGRNTNGQLGAGDYITYSTPTLVNSTYINTQIIAIAAGGNHSVALTVDGRVFSWGSNIYGQLGTGDTSGISQYNPIPTNTLGSLLSKMVLAITAGWEHTLVLTADNLLVSWGRNDWGQTGSGDYSNHFTPVFVNMNGTLLNKNIATISANSHYSMVLTSDNQLFSWGWNLFGQLGCGDLFNKISPVAVYMGGVLLNKQVSAIATGSYHAVALITSGTVYTWGYNGQGQLGNGDTSGSNQSLPVSVSTSGILNSKVITNIAAGGNFTIVLSSDGRLYSFGRNGEGQLGDASGVNQFNPVAVNMNAINLTKSITSIKAGWAHVVALTTVPLCPSGYTGSLCNIPICFGM
jgi:alpha-tubulin suppressor-like RCC1 family protein